MDVLKKFKQLYANSNVNGGFIFRYGEKDRMGMYIPLETLRGLEDKGYIELRERKEADVRIIG